MTQQNAIADSQTRGKERIYIRIFIMQVNEKNTDDIYHL